MIARFGPFTFDSDQRRLAREDGEIHLTPKAFDLLALLIDEAPRVVRKRELHERLWPGTFVSEATLVGLVKELRRALQDPNPDAPLIRTAHRVGYAFCGPLETTMPGRSGVSHWVVAGGRRIVLNEGVNLIGRDPAAAVLVDAAGVSRDHARITISRAGAVLEDLGSKNGTSVGGAPVTGPVRLHDEDRIEVGRVLLVFHASASGVSTATLASAVHRRTKRNPAP